MSDLDHLLAGRQTNPLKTTIHRQKQGALKGMLYVEIIG